MKPRTAQRETEPFTRASREIEDAYRLLMMRRGPHFDAKDNTLRIPYRFPCNLAREQWTQRHMQFDAKRHEYYIQIANPAHNAFGVLQRCRAFYFALYRAVDPRIEPI